MARRVPGKKDPQNALQTGFGDVPALILASGHDAVLTTADFFSSQIPNLNTRRAYGRALGGFLSWIERQGLTDLQAIRPRHVGLYLSFLADRVSVPTRKQALAAVRSYLDYMVAEGALELNIAKSVRGPKHSPTRGRTTVISADEARTLLDAIDVGAPAKPNLMGLRDRALIALMLFSFARVGAALKMNIGDIYTERGHLRLRLQEKGGKPHDIHCHHVLEGYLRAYISALGAVSSDEPLFRAFSWQRHPAALLRRLSYQSAYGIVRHWAVVSGVDGEHAKDPKRISNHTFRATGITTYLDSGGTLDQAQKLANHASIDTTRLYDRRDDAVDREEVEKLRI